MTTPLYEVFALRYANFADRTQGDNVILPDDHAAPMPLDFYVWVIPVAGAPPWSTPASTRRVRRDAAASGSAHRSRRSSALASKPRR